MRLPVLVVNGVEGRGAGVKDGGSKGGVAYIPWYGIDGK